MRHRSRFAALAASIAMVMALCALAGCSFSLPSGQGGATSTANPTQLVPQTTSTAKPGVLTVGVDYSAAPFAGTDSNGDVVGIDVDVAAALADQLGCTVEYVDVSDDTADSALQAGTVDVVMNVGARDYAAASVATVGPYLTDGPALFNRRDSSQAPAAASESVATSAAAGTAAGSSAASKSSSSSASIPNNANICAQTDSVSGYQAAKSYPSATIDSTSTLSEAFEQLSNGSADYAAADALVGAYIAQSYDNVAFYSVITTTTGLYVGVSPNNTQLCADVSSALQQIQGNGVLDLTIKKWTGSYIELPAPVDNASYQPAQTGTRGSALGAASTSGASSASSTSASAAPSSADAASSAQAATTGAND